MQNSKQFIFNKRNRENNQFTKAHMKLLTKQGEKVCQEKKLKKNI